MKNEVKSRECTTCKKELIGQQRKFCSKRCSQKYHKDERYKPLEEQNCISCKEPFMPTRRPQKFCSTKCRRKYHNRSKNKKLLFNKKCICCKEPFQQTRTTQKFCSRKCAVKYHNNGDRAKGYYEKNKDKKKKYQKEYVKNNRNKINKYLNKRYKENTIFRLNHNIKTMISKSLKLNNLSKRRRHWEDLVRYASQELREHLEKYFLPGMTWKNYGKWQVDHTIPIIFFRFKILMNFQTMD